MIVCFLTCVALCGQKGPYCGSPCESHPSEYPRFLVCVCKVLLGCDYPRGHNSSFKTIKSLLWGLTFSVYLIVDRYQNSID